MSGRWRARCSPRRRATRWPRATARLGGSSARRRTCAIPTVRAPWPPTCSSGAPRSSRSAASTRASARPRTPTSAGASRPPDGGSSCEREASVEHRYRTTLRDLRSQWRGYAAGRAWLARRYDGFEPEPALRRASSRAWRRVRRAPGADRPAARSRELRRRARRAAGARAATRSWTRCCRAEELAGLCALQPADPDCHAHARAGRAGRRPLSGPGRSARRIRADRWAAPASRPRRARSRWMPGSRASWPSSIARTTALRRAWWRSAAWR